MDLLAKLPEISKPEILAVKCWELLKKRNRSPHALPIGVVG